MLIVFRIKFRERVCMLIHAIDTCSIVYVMQAHKELAKYRLPNKGDL